MMVLKRIAITITVILALFGALFVYGLYSLITDGYPTDAPGQQPIEIEHRIECPDVQHNCM